MASRVDDAARLWLPRPVAGEPEVSREFAVLRTVAATALVAFPTVPLALSTALPVSLALPVGAALVGATALMAAVGGIAYMRKKTVALPAAAAQLPPVESAGRHYDCFAGLVTIHDVRGSVTAIHGRDAEAYLAWMRNPAGRGFIDQIHVSDRILFLQAIDALRQGNRKATIDIRLERPNVFAEGEQFVHMRCEMTALGEADDQLSSILVQSHDVSEEARLRAEAVQKTRLAETANDAKTRFLAAVSHELRTPLNAILGFSDILSGEYFGKLENDRQREYVSLINQSGAHLLSVVNTMLDMSKIEAGRYELMPEPFRVADVVNACEAMLDLQAREKGVQLISRIMRTVGEVNADQRAIQQILINLVGNAIKFTDRGGLVTIDAELSGSDLNLIVSDTGIGIAEDKLTMLGQPFVQIQNDYTRKYEGTGLGLSLVKGLVALHGGQFDMRSRPGDGTVITVTIPLDGSGIRAADDEETVEQTMVEFPPRLKERTRERGNGEAHPETGGTDADGLNGSAGHDGSQAKTA
ncbi:HAMP domain-containing histidine kinase [Pararhizobium sp. BT-229]|uniref:sensor histidine kinase n=1 Tax=Pararhizobium sp. BT-229 TaxID=2986923 RepID=UPI0021F71834|nr:HAMP domain-containing sensor histidine kinase [Pararhizobium sp. BT-229]MCV9963436.1 HAMP domain-containing histidine kinase [Pararhizobium sp. BT-229]